MVKILNKFAIGCIVQWYEIEIVESYLQSVKNAVDQIENKKNVIIDLQLDCSQSLEKVDKKQTTISFLLFPRLLYYIISLYIYTPYIFSINHGWITNILQR